MDHSYSTEREKVQKTDHSYFTVAKKTPKVVLRRAQLMKEQQESNRTSIGQDHSYVRPDHLLQLTEFINTDMLYADDEDDGNPFTSRDVQTLPCQTGHIISASEMSAIPSAFTTPIDNISTRELHLARCDLDNIDTQISGIRLDHAYDLKLNICAHKRSVPSPNLSEMMNQTVVCHDQLLSLRLHDHTYLGRSGMKVMDKA